MRATSDQGGDSAFLPSETISHHGSDQNLGGVTCIVVLTSGQRVECIQASGCGKYRLIKAENRCLCKVEKTGLCDAKCLVG